MSSSSSSSNSSIVGEQVNDRSVLFRWMITSYDVDNTPVFVDADMHFLAYQKEKCPTTGRLHWQIYLELKKKKRYGQIAALLGLSNADCSRCNGTPEQCLAYVTKEDTRVEVGAQHGVLSKGKGSKRNLEDVIECVKEIGVKRALAEYPEDVLRHLNALQKVEDWFYVQPVRCEPMSNPRTFQKFILDLIKTPAHDRHIYWFCDKVGGCGKTKLRIELAALHKAFCCEGGKVNDIIHNATVFAKKQETSVCVFDFARCSADYVSYQAIEMLKNGTWSSNKYTGGQVSISPPHVICFANDWPDLKKMSMDRWVLYEIEQVGEDYVHVVRNPHKVDDNTYIVV